jgi:hypothetical protein
MHRTAKCSIGSAPIGHESRRTASTRRSSASTTRPSSPSQRWWSPARERLRERPRLPQSEATRCTDGPRWLIEHARSLRVFGPGVDFEAPIWDLSEVKPARPSEAQTHRLFFTRIVERETRSMKGRIAFEPVFGGLIKTIITLRELGSPAGPSRYRKMLQASRHLYETLQDRGFDPTRLTSDHFEFACSAVVKTSAGNRYQIGQDLEEIAEFVNKHALAKTCIVFKSPHKLPRYGTKPDDDSRAKRASKMPSEDLIDAVIAMSVVVRTRGDDRDVLRAAIVELLMSAPWRINELLNLLKDCVRRQRLSGHTDATEAFGFAYGGSKGADDAIKWIPSAMVEIAERAMDDIIRITRPARDIAIWMERHPGRAFLAEPFRLADPATQLATDDVSAALGLASKEAATYWLKANDVSVEKRDGRWWCSLADLEAAVLELQPRLPPGSPPLSEHLLLVPAHYFRYDMASLHPIVMFVTDAQIHGFLSSCGKHKSIFERLDITDADGKPYVINSHAFRHYLNTIAKDGELPELDIARWSGRKNIEQNVAYDHTGGRQLAKRMRELHDTGAMRGPLADTIKKLPPAERGEFLKARINTVHTTDIGGCRQDFSLAPCPSHGACAGCGDHLVVKGNAVHKARAERLLAEHESMLAQAKSEVDEGTYGASDWVAHNEKLVAGLKKTIAVHDDPKIVDGTIVQV